MEQVIGLFPTPLLRVERLVPAPLVDVLSARIVTAHRELNAKSAALSHTAMVAPDADPDLARLAALVTPRVIDFGSLLFGENLAWQIKEIWTNVLETGGQQSIHSHANSFVSGVVYLTPCHPSTHTVFHRAMGGTEYVFSNFNSRSRIGPFNGSKWVLPAVNPGDLVLFPSYVLHEVPRNEGGRRMTIAFNAVPDRLESHGYTIHFAAASPMVQR